jgi:hypothetical protein
MVINSHKGDRNIVINNIVKKYVSSNNSVKYLGISMESRRISKVNFIETKVMKVLEELNKAEYRGLALNKIIRIIRCYRLNKLYYVFANMDVPAKYLKSIEQKVRNDINRFIKGRCLQKSFIYPIVRDIDW